MAAPAAATSQLSKALTAQDADAFAITTFADEAALTAAIQDREVYGGIVVTPNGPTVLTASAGSSAVAQSLTAMGTALAQQSGSAPTVKDVVPLTKDDPRGAGLGAAMLPLVMGAILPAALLGRFAQRRRVQLSAAVVYVAVAGLTFAAILHFWFGTLSGNYVAEAAAMSATIAAGLFVISGLQRVAGMVGFGLGAAALVLLGNPLSGAATAPEFLSSPWKEIGAAMPPGAGSQVLRSVSFFDGAGASSHWLVLGVWVVVGLALLALPKRKAS